MSVVWVSNVLIVDLVKRSEARVAKLDLEYLKEAVLNLLGESREVQVRVLIELDHVMLVLRRALVLLESIIILALLPAHFAVVLVLAQGHYNLIMIDDKFIFSSPSNKIQRTKTQVHTSHVITKVSKRLNDMGTQATPPLSVSQYVQNELGA